MTRSLQKHCANVTQSKYNNFELAATLELLSLDKCSTIPLPKIYESEPIWIFFGWNRFSFSQKEKKQLRRYTHAVYWENHTQTRYQVCKIITFIDWSRLKILKFIAISRDSSSFVSYSRKVLHLLNNNKKSIMHFIGQSTNNKIKYMTVWR